MELWIINFQNRQELLIVSKPSLYLLSTCCFVPIVKLPPLFPSFSFVSIISVFSTCWAFSGFGTNIIPLFLIVVLQLLLFSLWPAVLTHYKALR